VAMKMVWFGFNAISVPDQLWQRKLFGLVSMQYLFLTSCGNANASVLFQCSVCS